MIDLLYGEIYKIKKDKLNIIIVLIYLFTGIIFFAQCRSFLDYDITELSYDDTLGIFSLMLGDLSQYDNGIKSTLTILGIIAVFGFMSTIFINPILISISVSEEFSTRSFQQIIGKGVSRFKIVLSKFFGMYGYIILLEVMVVAIGSLTTITFLGAGTIKDFADIIIGFSFKFVLVQAACISASILCTFLVKNCGFAMPLNFIISICLISELSRGLLGREIIKPSISYILISIVFILITIFRFNKSDL